MALSAILLISSFGAEAKPRHKYFRTDDPEFFKTDVARQVGARILIGQRCTGGWSKNTDLVSAMTPAVLKKTMREHRRTDDSTIDNFATTMEMEFLARLNAVNPDRRYREAFDNGLEFLLSGQYENGGWPQFWPDPHGYQKHITYNDDAIYHVLVLFQKILSGKYPFNTLEISDSTRQRMSDAIEKAVDVIVNTQIVYNGEPTVWCQQHDENTLLPVKARAYEQACFSSEESGRIVEFLMSLPDPDERVKKSIRGAVKWFDDNKITGYRYVRQRDEDGEVTFAGLVEDAEAKPIWARCYDLVTCTPFFCDRDGIPRFSMDEIGEERRINYAWYSQSPIVVLQKYPSWADKYDADNKLAIN